MDEEQIAEAGAHMCRAKVNLLFEGGSEPTTRWDRVIEVPAPRRPQGEEFVASRIVSELEKELLWGQYHAELPEIEDLLDRLVRRKHRVLDTFSAFKGSVNVTRLWMENLNNLREIKILLAQSKAYKQIEPPHYKDYAKNNLLYNIHLTKMHHFDHAVFRLAKVAGLILRMLHEGLGASLVPGTSDDPEWERLLTVSRVAQSLQERAGNRTLRKLRDEEYNQLKEIVEALRRPTFMHDFLHYRNCLVHRITLSVDYPELFILLENHKEEPILDHRGRKIGTRMGFGATLTKAEYQFSGLYELARQVLDHYLHLLRQLKQISVFT